MGEGHARSSSSSGRARACSLAVVALLALTGSDAVAQTPPDAADAAPAAPASSGSSADIATPERLEQPRAVGEPCASAADCELTQACIAGACSEGPGLAAGAPPAPSEASPIPSRSESSSATSPPPIEGVAEPSLVGDEPPFAGSNLSLGVGYGNSFPQNAGISLGAFGMLQLSRSKDWTIGIPFAVALVNAKPESAPLLLSGVHVGRSAYLQALAGFVGGVEATETTTTDFNQGTLSKTTSYRGAGGVGVGVALGVNAEISRAFGINIQGVLAKALGTDGVVAGLFIGPAFFPRGTRKY